MICQICSKKKIKNYSIDCPTYEHSNYKILSKKLSRYECINCKLIFSNNSKYNRSESFNNFKYKNHKENHTYIVNGNPVLKEKLQSKIINQKIIKNKTGLNILDYGCFDGKLLNELSKYHNTHNLVGYDIVKSANLSKNKKISFYFREEKNLVKIYKKKFDIIIFSHVINYIPDIKKKFLFITKNLLKDNGFIFIQNPDISKKYLNIIFNDKKYFFNKTSISKLFNILDVKFNLSFISNRFIKNDFLLIVKKADNHINSYNKPISLSLYNIIKLIKKDISVYKNLSFDIKSICIFGSTIDAIFTSFYFKDSLKYFIDENKEKENLTLIGYKIYANKYKKLKDKVLIPNSMNADSKLKIRLQKNNYKII